jgi:hypothetical protein
MDEVEKLFSELIDVLKKTNPAHMKSAYARLMNTRKRRTGTRCARTALRS